MNVWRCSVLTLKSYTIREEIVVRSVVSWSHQTDWETVCPRLVEVSTPDSATHNLPPPVTRHERPETRTRTRTRRETRDTGDWRRTRMMRGYRRYIDL